MDECTIVQLSLDAEQTGKLFQGGERQSLSRYRCCFLPYCIESRLIFLNYVKKTSPMFSQNIQSSFLNENITIFYIIINSLIHIAQPPLRLGWLLSHLHCSFQCLLRLRSREAALSP